MSGFLDYLEDFNEKTEPTRRKTIEQKSEEEPKKNKVLALNVEVRSIDGAKLVIEKLQDWISKVENENGVPKKQFKIKPKQFVKGVNPPTPKKNVTESVNRAVNILDGLPDEVPESREPVLQEFNGMNTGIPMPQTPPPNLDSVAGHASALL